MSFSTKIGTAVTSLKPSEYLKAGSKLLSGAVLTESVFAFNGIGSYLFDAISTLDYAVLQGFILFIALIYALVNLVVDLLYGLFDPRMRVR